MATTIIIAAQTATATSSSFFNTKLGTYRTVSAYNLAGAEKVQIQYKHDSTNWISMGTAYQLTVASPTLVLSGEGEFRAVKDTTVGSSSVAISS